MPEPKPIQTLESPRQVIAEDFPSLGGELPIRGGWGYTQEDACIIDKNDPVVPAFPPFNGVAIEHTFVEKRNFEEFIICRHPGERFSGIKWQQTMVNTLQVGEKVYDHLTVEVTAFKEEDWDQMMAELDGPFGRNHPDFDFEAFDQKNRQKMMRFTREFWFDITSFYGK